VSAFLETVKAEYTRVRALSFAPEGYEGVEVAGVLVVARDTGAMLLARRAFDEDDDPEVAQTWEMPGGHLEDGEDAWVGAAREFSEEIGVPLPDGEVVHGWRAGDEDQYQGFVYAIEAEIPVESLNPDPEEVSDVVWATVDQAATLNLRPEFAKLDLNALVATVSGNKESSMAEDETLAAATQVGTAEEYLRTDEDGNELTRVEAPADENEIEEPMLSLADISLASIPVHGVLAPEDTESGDSRGFNNGAMTRRPYRLPFMYQKAQTSGHDGAVPVGSVDRLMRKDGLIHWEGQLMPSDDASDFAGLLAFFGRFGVSVDGDRGSLDSEKTSETGVVWFDAVRAAGLTAVSIPAFAEAYVAFGPHPDMPTEEALTASMVESGDLVTFDRGPGWVTNPRETKRIHDYWTKKGQPGYVKIGWGTPGDFTRAKKLIGEKIGMNSPEDLRYLNQIIAQWHYDALGYWPGDWDKPGNDTTAEGRAKRKARASLTASVFSIEALAADDPMRGEMYCSAHCGKPGEFTVSTPDKEWFAIYCAEHAQEYEDKPVPGWDPPEGIEAVENDEHAKWEAVLVSSVSGNPRPPLSYFHQHPMMVDDVWALESGALTVEEPDEFGFRRVWGFAAQWGVCHVGMDGRCVEPPQTYSDDYPEFHLGRTKTAEGYVYTGVLTYGVGHRDGDTILSESPEQAFFDNTNNAWAAVRVGENERGIWFSGVVLPGVPEEHLVKIEASGQVSGEWKRGAMRACLTVNVPGFPVERPSAAYDDEGNVLALAASAFGGVENSPCEPTPLERMQALAAIDAEVRFERLREQWKAVR